MIGVIIAIPIIIGVTIYLIIDESGILGNLIIAETIIDLIKDGVQDILKRIKKK